MHFFILFGNNIMMLFSKVEQGLANKADNKILFRNIYRETIREKVNTKCLKNCSPQKKIGMPYTRSANYER